MNINNEKIKEIIERRIIDASDDLKNYFPEAIQNEVRWVAFSNENLIILIFLDISEMERIQKFSKKGYDLFPGFITTEENVSAGMRMSNSKYGLVKGCMISGMYSFSVGPDCSFIVQDHSQSLKTNEAGDIAYRIPLAYVVSFGEENTESNCYETLEDLVSYSIKDWREKK